MVSATKTAPKGCLLDRYSVLVTGDVAADGTGVGPFGVEVALYDACPRAGGAVIPGTAVHVNLPDNGV